MICNLLEQLWHSLEGQYGPVAYIAVAIIVVLVVFLIASSIEGQGR